MPSCTRTDTTWAVASRVRRGMRIMPSGPLGLLAPGLPAPPGWPGLSPRSEGAPWAASTADAAAGSEHSMSRSGAEVLMSSSRVPWKSILPRDRMPRTPAVRSISSSRWEETMMVMPSAARLRRRARVSSMPAGSRPLAGSSRMSREGRRTSAMAMPRRCFIPREYSRTLLFICSCMCTALTARRTSSSPRSRSRCTMRMFSAPVRCP